MKSSVVAAIAASVLVLAGCVSTNVTPVSQNMIIITASAAPVCGTRGAQQVAYAQAAAETIRRGYDLFIILGSQRTNDVHVVGYTPTTATTNFNANYFGNTVYGNATTTAYGGTPIIGGSYDQDLLVQMFHYGDAGAANALDARQELGPDWQTIVADDRSVCF